MYFGTLLIFNLLHIILSIMTSFQKLAKFFDVLAVILISRFLLNLRQVCIMNHAQTDHASNLAQTSEFSNIIFATAVSVEERGEPLAFRNGKQHKQEEDEHHELAQRTGALPAQND